MRYRKKYRSKGLHYKVQTYFDIATSAESMQVLNFSVGGETLRKRCAHLFQAYKYFKLGKLSIKFVPASTLPVDPLGLSYADDDPLTVDPRDQLDCGLVRITNGEDIFDDLTGVTAEAQEGMYQAMLLDPRWFKFGLQSGFKRTAYPLYWQIGQLHQDMFPGTSLNYPGISANINNATNVVEKRDIPGRTDFYGNILTKIEGNRSDPRSIFQVGHRGRLGFLPTEAFQPLPVGSAESVNVVEKPLVSPIPEVRVITAILPKMRKTNYYYRVYITEEITFTGLRHYGPPIDGPAGSNLEYFYGEVDQFIRPTNVQAINPDSGQTLTIAPTVTPPNDGGDE